MFRLWKISKFPSSYFSYNNVWISKYPINYNFTVCVFYEIGYTKFNSIIVVSYINLRNKFYIREWIKTFGLAFDKTPIGDHTLKK